MFEDREEDFAPYPDVTTTTPVRLFPSAWCPNLDVYVLCSRPAEQNRIALWSYRGYKVWDRELDSGSSDEEISNICWSPDALIIAVAHGTTKITLHSVHDGSELIALPLKTPISGSQQRTNLWWMKSEVPKAPEAFNDLFNRNGIIPGTAHSILALLPLLEPTAKGSSDSSIGAPQHFGFQRKVEPTLPSREDPVQIALQRIPTLGSNPQLASIAPHPMYIPLSEEQAKEKPKPKRKDPTENGNFESLLVAGDANGRLYLFLDGFYPLGIYDLHEQCEVVSIYAPPLLPYNPTIPQNPDASLSAFLNRFGNHNSTVYSGTTCSATTINLPLLHHPWTRAMARSSSTVKDLLVYCTVALAEMKACWMGTGSREGASGVGRTWLGHLERVKAAHGGDEILSDALFDLNLLLLTGKGPHSVREFFSSGGRLQERALTQWEHTLNNALTVLQENSERKISPACERLVIVLEEVKGWSLWPKRYEPFSLSPSEISHIINQAHTAIQLAEWLAKEAEAELIKYREFAKWLRSESVRANDGSGELRPPNYDPIDVVDYLERGFIDSELDMWFTGPIPTHQPSTILAKPQLSVEETLASARSVIEENLQRPSDGDDFSRVTERNLEALINDMVGRCSGVFSLAGGAVTRESKLDTNDANQSNAKESEEPAARAEAVKAEYTRERLVVHDDKSISQFIAERQVHKDTNRHTVLITRVHFADWDLAAAPESIEVCGIDCRAARGDHELVDMDVLDMAFFDDEELVMILRPSSDENVEGQAYIAAYPYQGLAYESLPTSMVKSREEIGISFNAGVKRGQFQTQHLPQGRYRRLGVCRSGGGSLAVNGTPRRQVACVLDGGGQHWQAFDMARVDEEEDEEGTPPA